MPTPFGALWVDPLSPTIDFGAMPASELRTFSLVVPSLPVLGMPLVLQPIMIDTTGSLRIGTSATVVMH